jgi:hypothetical protein
VELLVYISLRLSGPKDTQEAIESITRDARRAPHPLKLFGAFSRLQGVDDRTGIDELPAVERISEPQKITDGHAETHFRTDLRRDAVSFGGAIAQGLDNQAYAVILGARRRPRSYLLNPTCHSETDYVPGRHDCHRLDIRRHHSIPRSGDRDPSLAVKARQVPYRMVAREKQTTDTQFTHAPSHSIQTPAILGRGKLPRDFCRRVIE